MTIVSFKFSFYSSCIFLRSKTNKISEAESSPGGNKDKHPKIAGDEEEQRAPVNRAVT